MTARISERKRLVKQAQKEQRVKNKAIGWPCAAAAATLWPDRPLARRPPGVSRAQKNQVREARRCKEENRRQVKRTDKIAAISAASR